MQEAVKFIRLFTIHYEKYNAQSLKYLLHKLLNYIHYNDTFSYYELRVFYVEQERIDKKSQFSR